MSPRIGILGQFSYKPEDRGLTDEVTNSVASQVKRIEDRLVEGYDAIEAYKDEAQRLRADLDNMLSALIDQNEDTLVQVQPELIEDYRTLKSHIGEQKDENEALYKQLLSLRTECQSSAQRIALFRSKIERLERTVGVARFTEEPGTNSQMQKTNAFVLDDTDDEGTLGGINTSQPTAEDFENHETDLMEDGII
jgi:predicted  nucleic acid-binding Zn-ribbon protein